MPTDERRAPSAAWWRPLLTVLIVVVILGVLALLAGRGFGPPARVTEAPEQAPPPRFGDRMDGIARRLERLGRAAVAGRWELARYEVEELKEAFEDVERTPLPEDLEELDVSEFIDPLVGSALPALDSALVHRDSAAVRLAFAGVAKGCNSCHRAAARSFVEIPAEPGAAIPALTPIPASR